MSNKKTIPDQKSNGDLLAKNKQPTVGCLNKVANSLQISIPASIDDLKVEIINLANNRVKAAVVQGVYCVELKERLGHGEYHKFLELVGIPQQRASEDVRIVEMLEKMPEDKIPALFDFGKTKLMELAKLDNAVLNATLESDFKIDDWTGMSVKELKTDIQGKEAAINSLKAEKENLQHELKKARAKRDYTEIADESNRPMHVVRARIEASHCQVQASIAIAEISSQFDKYIHEHEAEDEPANAALVNQSYYYAVVQLSEQARTLLEYMRNHGDPDFIKAMPEPANYPEGKEFQEIAKASAEIIDEHLYKKDRRAKLLANQFNTGAGRKFKVED